jgi:gluconate 2-dehydrogenase gamma chain
VTDRATTLTVAEAAFLVAAADTIIPADDLSPSGSQCGVVDFIDRELAGPYGAGTRLYRDGPIVKGKKEHGYQLGLTPREFFAIGIDAADDWARATQGQNFAALDEAGRQAALIAMETGKAEFKNFAAKEFFEALIAIVMEGFFADPIHGGNRDGAGWKMVGYPGLPASYRDTIETNRGKRLDSAPRGIADRR